MGKLSIAVGVALVLGWTVVASGEMDGLPLASQPADRQLFWYNRPVSDDSSRSSKGKGDAKGKGASTKGKGTTKGKGKGASGHYREYFYPTVSPTICEEVEDDDDDEYEPEYPYYYYDDPEEDPYYRVPYYNPYAKGKGKGDFISPDSKSSKSSKSRRELKSTKSQNIFYHPRPTEKKKEQTKKSTKSSKSTKVICRPVTRSPSATGSPSGSEPTTSPAPTPETAQPTVAPTQGPSPPNVIPSPPPVSPRPTIGPTPPVVTPQPSTGAPSTSNPTLTPNTGFPTTETPTLEPGGTLPPVTSTPTGTPVTSPPVTALPTTSPTTSAPTPSEDTEVEASPFFALYEWNGPDPTLSDSNFQQAAAVTANYINDYMIAFFDFADDTVLENVQTRIGEFERDPVRIGFDVDYVFGAESTLVPTQQQIDTLLIQAFQQPNVQALLAALRGIPGTNPFSAVADVSYTTPDGTVFLEGGSMSGAGVAAVAAGCLVVASALALYLTNRAKRRGLPLLHRTDSSSHAPKIIPVAESEDTASECTGSVARSSSTPPSNRTTLKAIDEGNETSFTSLKEGRRIARGYGYMPNFQEEEEEDEDIEEEVESGEEHSLEALR